MSLHKEIDKSLTDGSLELGEKLEEIMSSLDKKLDTNHSVWIRLLAVDENGKGECACCGDKMPFNLLVCGHFIKRRHTRFRWSKQNTEAICPDCNRKDEEGLNIMREFKFNQLGVDVVEQMERAIHLPYKISKYDKETLLRTRRLQIRKLLENKNFTVNIV
jgi:hypothetical protein